MVSGDTTGAVPFSISSYSDTAGNSGATVTTTTDASTVTLDKTAPTVAITSSTATSGSTTSATTLSYTATFSESVTGFDATDLTISGTANGGSPAASNFVPVSGSVYTFDVLRGTSDGTVIVSIAASQAIDAASNPNTASNTYTLTIDSTAPTLSPVHIQSNNVSTVLAKTGNTVTVSFTSSEPITGVSGTIGGQAATPTNTSGNNWTLTRTLTGAETEGVLAFTINFSDLIGNAGTQVTTTTDASSVTYDKTAPTVTNVSSTNDNGVYNEGDTVTITVTFDEVVYASVLGNQKIHLETGATDQQVSYTSGSGTDTLSFVYTVLAGHTSADLDYKATDSLTASGVASITDAAGNDANLTLATPGAAGSLGFNKNIVIDTAPPTAVLTTNLSLIADADVGSDTFTVTATFSEAMNNSIAPTISFIPAVASTLSFTGGVWSVGNTVYTATYNVADAGVEVADVDVSASGAQDIGGTTMTANTTLNLFDIDTKNPTSVITSNLSLITDANVGSDTSIVTATFDETMNNSVAPTLTFTPDVSSTLTFTGGIWSAGDTVYTATYDVADANVEINDIDVTSSNAEDLAGNLDPDTTMDVFSIDTKNLTPNITSSSSDPTNDEDRKSTRLNSSHRL